MVVLSDSLGALMARRVRLDVRWDAETVAVALEAAGRLGVRASEVMRRAAEEGMGAAIVKIRVERARAGSTLPTAGVRTRADAEREFEAGLEVVAGMDAGAVSTVPAAGVASSRASAAADPRPAAAQPASQVRLEAVVARMSVAAGGARPGRMVTPADTVAARKKVLAGRVLVGGLECRNPVQLVDPAAVTLAL